MNSIMTLPYICVRKRIQPTAVDMNKTENKRNNKDQPEKPQDESFRLVGITQARKSPGFHEIDALVLSKNHYS